MVDEYRVTIRLTPDIYALLEARGSRGLPLAAIVREALIDYLTRQPGTAMSPDIPTATEASLAASLEDLRQQVAALSRRVDELAAQSRQTAASPRQPRQPSAASRVPTAPPTRQAATPPEMDTAYQRMQALRAEGWTLAQIAAQLTREGYRTRQGKPWHKSTVSYVLRTHGR
jgi:hypothetical protein